MFFSGPCYTWSNARRELQRIDRKHDKAYVMKGVWMNGSFVLIKFLLKIALITLIFLLVFLLVIVYTRVAFSIL